MEQDPFEQRLHFAVNFFDISSLFVTHPDFFDFFLEDGAMDNKAS